MVLKVVRYAVNDVIAGVCHCSRAEPLRKINELETSGISIWQKHKERSSCSLILSKSLEMFNELMNK